MLSGVLGCCRPRRLCMMISERSLRCLTVRRVVFICMIYVAYRVAKSYTDGLTHHDRHLVQHTDDLTNHDPNLVQLHNVDLTAPITRIVSNATKNCTMSADGSCTTQQEEVHLGKGLYAYGDKFYLNGRAFRILSGSFHYFRTQPADWGDRLVKMKAAGLNTVTTYVPWNVHEPVKGRIDFSGRWDLASFIRLAQQVGLLVIVRPGPYICAEWEYGGLPAWLLRDPEMKMRTSYQPFLSHVSKYFQRLFPLLLPLTYKQGGPIVAFQVENEYGSYASDKDYMNFLVEQYMIHGINELLFTSDGSEPDQLQSGTVPGILATVNFKKEPKKHLEALKKFQPNKPLMVTEYWSGWFDHWSEKRHTMDVDSFLQNVTEILEMGASINFYMFVGGTNFEFWNGANMNKEQTLYEPTITSYDYDAPISEDGTLTEKYLATRKLLAKYSEQPLEEMAVTVNTPRGNYGHAHVENWLPYKTLTDTAADYVETKYGEISRQEPVTMEFLDIDDTCGQNVGFLLYRTQVETDKPKELEIQGTIHDRAQVLLNSEVLTTLYRNEPLTKITIPVRPATEDGYSRLDILVENMGRVNYKALNMQFKGILATCSVGEEEYLPGWDHVPMDFSEEFVNILLRKDNWLSMPESVNTTSFSCPGIFKTHLDLDSDPRDTYIDLYGWTKGIVLVNGYNIGRYWRIGPQRTLYLPKSLLAQGKNTILIFELHRPHDSVSFTDQPMLDNPW